MKKHTKNLKSVQVVENSFTLDQECYDIVTAKERKKTTTIISATNRYVLPCS